MTRHFLPFVIPVLLLLHASSILAQTSVSIGVFAYRDKAFVQSQFQPIAQAIQEALPKARVQLKVLTLNELDKAIEQSRIDYILTNPRHFLAIRQKYRVSGALATLQKPQGEHMLSSLGGVILVSAGSGLSTLGDLQGQTIGIPGKRFLGGYLTQAYEIKQAGYLPERFAKYRELGSHDAVKDALIAGDINVGFVRTGILEDWQSRLNNVSLRVVNARPTLFYPLARSTRLYPEWAFAAMPHVPMDSIRRVSNALLNMKSNQTEKDLRVGFDPPQDYLQVENAARALGAPPFSRMPIWQRLKEQYGSGVWLLIFLAMALVMSLIALIGLNLKKTRMYRRFNALFYFSPSAKLIVEARTAQGAVIIEANHAAAALFGYDDAKSLIDMPVEKLSPPLQPDGQPSYLKSASILSK